MVSGQAIAEAQQKSESIVENMARNLEAIGQSAAELSQMDQQTMEQEIEVLQKLFDKVRPIMRYIDYRIKTSYFDSGEQSHNPRYEYAGEKGIILAGKIKQIATDKDYRGIYDGDRLILTRSGKLIRQRIFGEWSNWQGESSLWSSDDRSGNYGDMESAGDLPGYDEISINEAVKRYGFKHIIDGLANAFSESIEKAEKKKQTLGVRLDQLEQIKAILH